MRWFKLLSILLLLAPELIDGAAADPFLTEKDKIQALIKNIESLQAAKFIRNDREYDAATAARFLRGKWQAQEKQVKTAVDFIEKIGTASSTSGKPYVIRFKDGREIKCGEHLKTVLKKLEAPPVL